MKRLNPSTLSRASENFACTSGEAECPSDARWKHAATKQYQALCSATEGFASFCLKAVWDDVRRDAMFHVDADGVKLAGDLQCDRLCVGVFLFRERL